MTFDEFLKYIRLGENPTGSYDTLFNNSQVQGKPFEGTNVSQMTLDQLYQFSDPKGPYGQYVKGCLLYTSPSPRDLSTSRMPSSA